MQEFVHEFNQSKHVIRILFRKTMKRLLIFIISTVFCNAIFGMEKIAPLCEIKGDLQAMSILLQAGIREARSKSATEKQSLFEKTKESFPLKLAIARVNEIKNPQVILWFSNYFGGVKKAQLEWNKTNLFKTMPNATFWLTDLKAWGFLSVDAKQLGVIYKGLVTKLKSEGQLSEAECPLLTQSSSVVDNDITKSQMYRLLASKSFFKWLLEVEDMELINDDTCNRLCKDLPREESLPYSLAEMGFKPKLLNRSLVRYAGKEKTNMLDVEFSLIYPVLQYLEGIYYATRIIESKLPIAPGEEVSVVFLLPNKEFAYYAVPDENVCFQLFKEGIEKALAKYKNQIQGKISIFIEPFAYGDNFYDAPYYLGNKPLKKQKFLMELQKK